uniref:RUN domain-containing protein n=1 Tax=Panagrellus redivivus TaxID=6233 RepID=A0A7E4V270_PANRE
MRDETTNDTDHMAWLQDLATFNQTSTSPSPQGTSMVPSRTESVNSAFKNKLGISDEELSNNGASTSFEDNYSIQNSAEKLSELEEEHARLSNSILSLSSHFAQIQFRLQQVTLAPPEKRDALLQELQQIASKPCIDLDEIKQDAAEIRNSKNDAEVDEKRRRVLKLIRDLKSQTEDLEKFAYEQGSGELPSTELKNRQKLVFEKLQENLNLNIELENLTEHELQHHVDLGICKLLEPIKEKEQLVDQLQTQIVDLERFVSFLQLESYEKSSLPGSPKLSERVPDAYSSARSLQSLNRGPPRRSNSYIFGLIPVKKQPFERNELKNTLRGNHYGDQRARLELAVDSVIQVLQKHSIISLDGPTDINADGDHDVPLDEPLSTMPDDNRRQEIFEWSEEAVVTVVRKTLCPSLKDLLEHGMKSEIPAESSLLSMGVLGCFPNRTAHLKQRQGGEGQVRELNHIWDVIVYFYEDRKQRELTDGSVGKLSQTFNLNDVQGKQITSRELLMYTIENIISTHKRLKRTPDAMWKAFVSAAMNEKKLPAWIRMIFRADFVVMKCYHSWSYVRHTGCEDIRPLLEKLHEFHVDLPVDLAIRPFEHIKDAF